MIEIELSNQQDHVPLDLQRFEQVAREILHDHQLTAVQLSIAVVTDPVIHRLNREYLDHDYATDVLSFVLEQHPDGSRDGEVLVSIDTAARVVEQLSSEQRQAWQVEDELLLYVVHGLLHFVGMDDQTEPQRAAMRSSERHYLKRFGLVPPEAEDPGAPERQIRQAGESAL